MPSSPQFPAIYQFNYNWEIFPVAKNFIGERGIWGSSRKHPVCSFHPRLRAARHVLCRILLKQGFRLEISTAARRFKSLNFRLFINLTTIGKFFQLQKIFSEREGFEPSVPFQAHTTSNRAPSTTRTSLQISFRIPNMGTWSFTQ